MTSPLLRSLREAPATVPALGAIVLFIVWATTEAGYPLTHWGPGALIVLVLLGLAVTLVGLHWSRLPLPVRIAVCALAGYTALSYASILWAGETGVAWEGANRTLLYLLVFALFACWPRRGMSAALLLCLWVLAMIGLAVFVVVHLYGASGSSLQGLLPEGRLTYPSGYANANAAEWLMAFWPALLLARSDRLPWGLRGLLAGGAVLLAEIALLSQSRGSLYVSPVMLVLVFAFLPSRTRTFLLLLPVAAGIAAAAPAVLHVGNDLTNGVVVAGKLHTALTASLLAAVAVGVVVAVAAATESRMTVSQGGRIRIKRAAAWLAVVTLIVVIAGGLAAAGDPVTRVRHAWDTFTSERGYAANGSGSRLTSGLGSSRYDFYRVALDEFTHHPILGVGADNFAQQYLIHGRSSETPHYPHSVELRTLSQTGLAGAILALIGLGAALLACARAISSSGGARGDPLGRAVAAAALAGFGYWVLHGSVDWFWEFAGLGAPAFAMLGLACSLAPVARSPEAAPSAAEGPSLGVPPAGRHARRARARSSVGGLPLGLTGVALALALACAASLALPWFSQLEIESAAKVWRTAPLQAYARLKDAAGLNPLSDEADIVAGTIALRYEEVPRAEHDFSLALARNGDDLYATLVNGVLASITGEHSRALLLLERAVRLGPRESLAQEALELVRAGRPISLPALNRAFLRKAQQFL
jgi:hypothetical protein